MEFIKESNRIWLANSENQMIAEVTFPQTQEHVVTINHTFVDTTLRGQGVAGKLMEEIVSLLTETNQKAIPTCSYAVKWFNDHPQHQHLIKE